MSSPDISTLPHLALFQMFKHLDLLDLLSVSLYSDRIANAVSLSDFKVARYVIKLRSTFLREVSIQVFFRKQSTLTWRFYPEFIAESIRIDDGMKPLEVSGELLMCGCLAESQTISTFGSFLESSLAAVMKHLLYAFPCSSYQIELDEEMFFKMSSFIDEVKTLNCEELKVRCSAQPSKNNLELIISTLKPSQSAGIYDYDGEAVNMTELINLETLKLVEAQWLTPETFFTFNCERIVIGVSQLNGNDINAFIHEWLRGGFSKMKGLTMSIEHFSTAMSNDLLTGLQVAGWDQNTRSRYYKLNEKFAVDCHDGIDIERNDGKMATILFEQWTFHFFVWHERFPDFSLPEGQFYTQTIDDPFLEAKYPAPEVFSNDEDAEFDRVRRINL